MQTYSGIEGLTSRISVLDIEPCISCLFAKMSRDAPASRCRHGVRDQVRSCEMCRTDIFLQKAVKLFFAVLHAHAVSRIDDPYKRVGLLEVISPVWPKCPLPADVP